MRSLSFTFRVMSSTPAPNGRNRAAIVAACCFASTVVGASTNTCPPPANTRKIARIATSVFPNPTSPTTMRSIGVSRVVRSS